MTFHRYGTATGLGLLGLALLFSASLLSEGQGLQMRARRTAEGRIQPATLRGRVDTPRSIPEEQSLPADRQTSCTPVRLPTPFVMTFLQTPAARATIEGVVVLGGLPHAEGTVSLWCGSFSAAGARVVSHAPPDAVCTLGEDGTFRFEYVQAGAFTVGYRPRHGAWRLRHVRLPEQQGPTRRILFHLGEGSVVGIVHGPHGRPLREACVRAVPRRGRGGTLEVLTDGDGSYTLDHLLPVHYRIAVRTLDDEGLPASETKEALVEPRGVLRLDFGDEAGDHILWGVVRGRDGCAVRGPSTIRLTRADRRGALAFRYGANGLFKHAALAGRYRVHVTLPGIDGETVQLPEMLDLTLENLQHDFVIPGARVHGSVHGLKGASRLRLELHVARTAVHATSHPTASVDVDEEGLFELHGVPPGRYRIRGHPWRITDMTGEPAVLSVRASQSACSLALKAHPP